MIFSGVFNTAIFIVFAFIHAPKSHKAGPNFALYSIFYKNNALNPDILFTGVGT